SGFTLRRSVPLDGTVPQVGDEYGLTVLYEDGITCDLPFQVSGVWGAWPTLLTPNGNGKGSAQPTFTWTAPSGAPKWYSYEGSVSAPNGGNSDLWRFDVPSTTTTATYNSDGKAKPSSLSEGVGYEWWLDASDRYGNTTRGYAYFSLPISESAEPN